MVHRLPAHTLWVGLIPALGIRGKEAVNWRKITAYAFALLAAQFAVGFFEGAFAPADLGTALVSCLVSFIVCGSIFAHLSTSQTFKPFAHAFAALALQVAAAGSWRPTFLTSGIALMLALWSLYALSGAGLIPRLPFVRQALCVIASIYLLRGVAGFAFASFAPGSNGPAFWWWSSAICLTIGAVHFVGTWQAWPQLSRAAA